MKSEKIDLSTTMEIPKKKFSNYPQFPVRHPSQLHMKQSVRPKVINDRERKFLKSPIVRGSEKDSLMKAYGSWETLFTTFFFIAKKEEIRLLK